MIWVAMIVMVLDRKWVAATVWALIGSFFALFGIIHVPQAGFEYFSSPTYEQCWQPDGGTPTCWDFAEQWMFFVGYIILAAHFAIIEVARRYFSDESLGDILDDPSAHAFDNWFVDASKTKEEFDAEKSMRLAGELSKKEIAYELDVAAQEESWHEEGHKEVDL
jgi:hypothetical protein